MKKFLAVLCLVLLPFAAMAGEQPLSAAKAVQVDFDLKSNDGLSSGNIGAIGVGIIGGLVVLDGMLGVPAALAALAGGIGGHLWYKQYEDENIVSFQFRKPSHFAISHAAGNDAQRVRWLGTDKGI
jgi:hypothetical protein